MIINITTTLASVEYQTIIPTLQKPPETKCVIVVNWNSGPYLRKCLHAVLSQSVPVGKIIVVDNASSDASLLEAEGLLLHVQLIRLPHKTGFAACNNIAVKAAEGYEWIAFLNPDAFPEPDWLERLLHDSSA